MRVGKASEGKKTANSIHCGMGACASAASHQYSGHNNNTKSNQWMANGNKPRSISSSTPRLKSEREKISRCDLCKFVIVTLFNKEEMKAHLIVNVIKQSYTV